MLQAPAMSDTEDTPWPSRKEREILRLLMSGERYGLQLVNESGGRIKRGTVYVTLQRMQEKGFVTSREESPEEVRPEIGLPRRLYKITGAGSRAVDAMEMMAGRLVGAT